MKNKQTKSVPLNKLLLKLACIEFSQDFFSHSNLHISKISKPILVSLNLTYQLVNLFKIKSSPSSSLIRIINFLKYDAKRLIDVQV